MNEEGITWIKHSRPLFLDTNAESACKDFIKIT
jgi:hypothetical protein